MPYRRRKIGYENVVGLFPVPLIYISLEPQVGGLVPRVGRVAHTLRELKGDNVHGFNSVPAGTTSSLCATIRSYLVFFFAVVPKATQNDRPFRNVPTKIVPDSVAENRDEDDPPAQQDIARRQKFLIIEQVECRQIRCYHCVYGKQPQRLCKFQRTCFVRGRRRNRSLAERPVIYKFEARTQNNSCRKEDEAEKFQQGGSARHHEIMLLFGQFLLMHPIIVVEGERTELLDSHHVRQGPISAPT
mmetsp:Transcript_5121/g.15318  ORF Transcript_5121/g.15318 Transcript_5121/m.15318 type:complete len:244 (+) Transcript_5121:523-1254(+)